MILIVLSTRAGGLGLNLTAANTVIMHDQDFKFVFFATKIIIRN